MIEADGIVVAIFQWIYRRRKARPLEEKKPWLKWFPKYRATLRPAPGILKSEDPSRSLEICLEPIGFKHESWTKETIQFTRGKSWGDFHAKLIKLRVSFSYPLGETVEMRLEVAKVCLFDTGDLWKIAHEIKDRVEADDPGNGSGHS